METETNLEGPPPPFGKFPSFFLTLPLPNLDYEILNFT